MKKETKMEQALALGRINLFLLAAGVAVIILGFVLMSGPASCVEFNPDIYSFRRITLGPMISLAGFVFIIFVILWNPKRKEE